MDIGNTPSEVGNREARRLSVGSPDLRMIFVVVFANQDEILPTYRSYVNHEDTL